MKTGVIIGIVVVLVVLGAIIFGLGSLNFSKQQVPDNTDVVSLDGSIGIDEGEEVGNGIQDEPSPTETQTHAIEITSSGFSPKTLEINQGDMVVFTNLGTSMSWPASTVHPTHTNYPGPDYNDGRSYSGSRGCIAEGQTKEGAFDACKGLVNGESYIFTFNEIGSWNYHDHLRVSNTGTIIVN